MPYSTILFDLDGTLTDPKLGITRSVQYALAKFDILVEDLDSLTKFIGPPLLESFTKYYGLSTEQAWQAIGYYREYFAPQGIYENAVFPGIPELLETLCQEGKTLFVATSKATPYAQQILEHYHLDQYFSRIVGSHLDGTRVVKSEVIAEILQELQPATVEHIIMVGDREHDVIGARENGLATIGVTFGYGTQEELRAAGAYCLAHTVDELKAILLR